MEHIIKQFAYKLSAGSGLDVEDAKQELRIVVWKCQTKHDPSKGEYEHYICRALKNFTIKKIYSEAQKRYAESQAVVAPVDRLSMEEEILTHVFFEGLYEKLSAQGQDVLQGLLSGYTHSEIGQRLCLSRSRVTNIVAEIKHIAYAYAQ